MRQLEAEGMKHRDPGASRTGSVAARFGILLLLLIVASRSDSASAATKLPAAQTMTPLLLSMLDAPVPFTGSDGHIHLVYELWLTNFSSGSATIEQVNILSGGAVLQTLNTAEIARRLMPAGTRRGSQIMASSTQSLLFTHLILPIGAKPPRRLSHQVIAHFDAAPPGSQKVTATLDNSPVDNRPVVVVGPPLRGQRFISADSCCDAARHTQAALPVNDRVWVAQRYAVDWEQLDAQNRVYVGPKLDLKSYKIYGQPVYAVADGKVLTAINDQPDQPPGAFPTGLTVDQADGNAVILDLARGNWAVYGHMQRGSIRVRAGQRVKRGQVIGLVGNSGNTLAPHLHFQVVNGPFSVGANGLPYVIDSYRVTAISPSTAAFDKAEADGTPLDITPVEPPKPVSRALPLDQLIISFQP
jgi:hypothetical protein